MPSVSFVFSNLSGVFHLWTTRGCRELISQTSVVRSAQEMRKAQESGEQTSQAKHQQNGQRLPHIADVGTAEHDVLETLLGPILRGEATHHLGEVRHQLRRQPHAAERCTAQRNQHRDGSALIFSTYPHGKRPIRCRFRKSTDRAR